MAVDVTFFLNQSCDRTSEQGALNILVSHLQMSVDFPNGKTPLHAEQVAPRVFRLP
jgi:hypothetical protein